MQCVRNNHENKTPHTTAIDCDRMIMQYCCGGFRCIVATYQSVDVSVKSHRDYGFEKIV